MSKLVALRLVKKIEPKELLQREEVHLRQRTKVKWVKEGVTTLKYFHKVANGRRKKKFSKSPLRKGSNWRINRVFMRSF